MKSMLSPLIGLASGRRPLLGTSREDNSYTTQPSSVEARPQGQGKSGRECRPGEELVRHQRARIEKSSAVAERGPCPFRKSHPDVMVVQPGQDWDRDNGTGALYCPTDGRVFAKRQVRAHLIVVGHIRRKNLPQVRLAEDQHPVQALATYGANQALRIRILPW